MDIKKQVEAHFDELMNHLGVLVQHNSIQQEATEGNPFGETTAACLQSALKIADGYGFKTKNLENYAGYAEIGEGEKIIGILGHLDIVPAGDGWTSNPFQLRIENGKVYGRGVLDDKGPVVASMIAMKIVKDMAIPLNKRVRLIMGCNEENGSKCLKYYVEKEGHIDAGFTPDGDFPGVHGEKGMIALKFKGTPTKIKSVHGGLATNIVCDCCEISVEKNTFSQRTLEDYFLDQGLTYSFNEVDGLVKIVVRGTAAHASTPFLGINAISHTLVGLKQAGMQDPFVDFFNQTIGVETDGSCLGLACSDEYGNLTSNVGIIRLEDGVIWGKIDIRFPVSMTSKQVLDKLSCEHDGGDIEVLHVSEPLYFPTDHPLVKKLLKAYREVTKDEETQPVTMGGGTYARGIRNCIAFGGGFPGVDNHIHDVDEFIMLDELKLQTEIYVHAILELLKD